MTLEQLGRSSMQMRFSGRVGGEERFRVRHRTAMISMETLRATSIPETLRVRAQPFLAPAAPDAGLGPLEVASQPPGAFTSRQVVRYEHCDPAGRVYFARFFDMFNAALEDWFAQALACPWGSELMVPPRELRTPSLNIDVEFLRPCLLGELLEYHLWPTRLGRSSFDLALCATCNGVERLRARWTLCMTSHYTGHSVPIPGALRRRMEQLLPPEA
jgi:4-hydroxybenzoyl-CoA thioesterase